MNRGQLDTLVIAESRTPSRNSAGETTYTYSEFGRGYAKVENKSGAEPEQASQKVYETTKLLTLTYIAGLTSDMRLQFNAQYWDIIDIHESVRGRYQQVTVKTKDNK